MKAVMNQSEFELLIEKWLEQSPASNATDFNATTAYLVYWYFEFNRPIVLLYLVVSSLICLFGTFCNGVCLAAIWLYPPLRRRGNILVANFVLVNLILSAVTYPLSFVWLACRHYCTWPNDTCNWTIYYYFTLHSLTWQECFLAINRFVAVVLPHQYTRLSSLRAITISIALGYIIPLAINLPAAGSNPPSWIPVPPFGGCQYNKLTPLFQGYHAVLGVYLPMTVVGTAYCAVFVRVGLSRCAASARSQVNPAGTAVTQSRSMQRRITLARMLFASFLWYCLSYLPAPIMTAIFPLVYDTYPGAFVYARFPLYMGATMNAIIYAATNQEYRFGMAFVLARMTGRPFNPEIAARLHTKDRKTSKTNTPPHVQAINRISLDETV